MSRRPRHPYMRVPRQTETVTNPYLNYYRRQEPMEETEAPEVPQEEAGENTQPEASQPQESAPEKSAEAAPGVDAKAEIEEARLRMAAEMDNFKKRLNREHQEQMRYASEKVLSDLLPALDNLDLAIQYGSTHEACKDMMQGIEMTRKQLLDAVAKSGLTTVGEAGEGFNPEIHEAIGVEANPDLEKGAVSRVLQRGYKLNDRLLRPAKVMVNN